MPSQLDGPRTALFTRIIAALREQPGAIAQHMGVTTAELLTIRKASPGSIIPIAYDEMWQKLDQHVALRIAELQSVRAELRTKLERDHTRIMAYRLRTKNR